MILTDIKKDFRLQEYFLLTLCLRVIVECIIKMTVHCIEGIGIDHMATSK